MSQEIVKYITMAAYNDWGEPTVRPIHPGTMEKIATPVHPLIKQAAAELEPRDDGIWVLVNALGAMEYWGANTNGDAFPEEALKHACPMETCPREQDYGYRTFMKYAFPYRHHANKDPAKAIGERVKIAVWNDEMKRVELIHFLRRESEFDDFGELSKVGAADLINKIESGETPSVSMGCKVPYDICSQCHNRAKNTSYYCDHLKLAMNQVLPDGRTICAINTLPKFFDISYVLRGADKTATVLQKIAGAKDALRASGNKTFHFIAEGMEKAASEKREYVMPSAFYAEMVKEAQETGKNGTMAKEVPSNVTPKKPDASQQEARVQRAAKVLRLTDSALPESVMKSMAGYPMGDILSTMTGMGMALKPHEARKLVVIKIRSGKGPEDLGSPTVSPEHVRPSLASLLKEQMEGRSALREPLRQRVLKLLSHSGDKLQSKVAASDELTQGSLGELADETTQMRAAKSVPAKAVPKAAVDATTALVIKKAQVDPELAESLMAQYLGESTTSEKVAAVKTVAHGLTGRGKAALVGGALAAPYLYSGYVQQKARQGRPIGRTEAWLANNPGVTAVGTTVAALKGNKAIARKLWERQQRKMVPRAKVAEDHSGNSFATLYNNLDVVGTLRYGTDPELVDEAIIAGLCKIADRIGL
jgi:hypothetical protein